jgi:3-deoxy-D-manno-octulosonic-acid transferase
VFSKPVIFGKFMGNFSEISRILKDKNAAIQVSDKEEFTKQAIHLLETPELCNQIGSNAFDVVKQNSGAVNKSVDILARILR